MAPAMFGMDVVERDNAYIVNAGIPGVIRDDVEVSSEGDQVTISAEVKRAPEARDGERVLRSERYRGSI
jgi:HSP20 family protein